MSSLICRSSHQSFPDLNKSRSLHLAIRMLLGTILPHVDWDFTLSPSPHEDNPIILVDPNS